MSAVDTAWQAALAAEHQAVFGFGLLGPQVAGTERALARATQKAHGTLRDGTESAMAAAHLNPVAPLRDYPQLYPVPDAAAAARLAVRLEDACADAWRVLYLRAASQPGPHTRALRRAAQTGLTGSAIRGTRWRSRLDPAQPAVAFPGL